MGENRAGQRALLSADCRLGVAFDAGIAQLAAQGGNDGGMKHERGPPAGCDDLVARAGDAKACPLPVRVVSRESALFARVAVQAQKKNRLGSIGDFRSPPVRDDLPFALFRHHHGGALTRQQRLQPLPDDPVDVQFRQLAVPAGGSLAGLRGMTGVQADDDAAKCAGVRLRDPGAQKQCQRQYYSEGEVLEWFHECGRSPK